MVPELDEWCERFDDWMRNAQPEALLNASIFFDFRILHSGVHEGAVEAAEALVPALRRFLLGEGRVTARRSFGRWRPTRCRCGRRWGSSATSWSRRANRAARSTSRHYGSRPFVDCARVLALAAGVEAT